MSAVRLFDFETVPKVMGEGVSYGVATQKLKRKAMLSQLIAFSSTLKKLADVLETEAKLSH